MADLKPWPRDAVVVIASLAGQERREVMEGVHTAACRDCGARLHADTFTVRRAETMPQRRGRPVAFLCLTCHAGYEQPAGVVERHDTPEGRRDAADKMGGAPCPE